MYFLQRLSPRTAGLAVAVITVTIRPPCIARASAQGSLMPSGIALAQVRSGRA